MSNPIKCPKCRYGHRPWDGIETGDELDCESCGFRFAVDVHIVREFETYCVEHKFGDTQTDRYGESYAVCKRCDFVRTVEVDKWEVFVPGSKKPETPATGCDE